MRIVEKDLIHDEAKTIATAEFKEAKAFGVGRQMTRWIIRMNHDDGTGPGVDVPFQLGHIDPPTVIVEEWVRAECDVGKIRQILKERIAGLRDQDFISHVAEKTAEMAVGFAGAGSQDDLRGRDHGMMPGIVADDRRTRRKKALCVGLVIKGLFVEKRLEDF